MKKHRLIIIMGVSGSGKSTIGKEIASKLGVEFYDGDDFHPEANVSKMESGQPLDDQDRLPWLTSIHSFAKQQLQTTSIVIACSALKEGYRDLLEKDLEAIFIYLKGSIEVISERLNTRQGHFMPTELLESQFQTLEEPTKALIIPINQSIDEIVEQSLQKLVY